MISQATTAFVDRIQQATEQRGVNVSIADVPITMALIIPC